MTAGIRLAAIVVWMICLAAFPAAAEKRVALVIGNNEYPSLSADEQLQKAVNDANAVGETLETIGFEVMRGANLSRGQMLTSLLSTADKLEPGDLAFFFYAGHGVSIDGANYLLPSDIPPATAGGEDLIKLSAVPESTIVSTLKARGVRVAMVVLDACRNNPFSQGGTRSFGDGTRGLARPPAVETRGVFGLYSAGFGEAALDRLGDDDPDPNSVFTRVLVPALETPGKSLLDIAYAVNEEVARLAGTVGHEQNPAYYDQARARDVYLAATGAQGAPKIAPPDVRQRTTEGESNSCASARVHFETARDLRRVEALQDHLRRFGDCEFAGLAEMLIQQLQEPSGQRVAAIEPPDGGGPLPASGVDPDAIARALTGAIAGTSGLEISYDRASREGADVVIEGIAMSAEFVSPLPPRFSRTVIKSPTPSADGGFASPQISFADGRFDGGTKGSLGSIIIVDFATIPQSTAGGGAATPGFTFRTLEAKELRLQHPTEPAAISVERLFAEAGDFVGNRPQDIRGRIERLSLPPILFVEAGVDLGALGYDSLVLDIVWDGSFDLARKTMALRDLNAAVENGGVLSLTAALRRIPELGGIFSPSGAESLRKVEIQSLSMRYDDNSLASRFFDFVGGQEGKPRATLAEELETNISRDLDLDPAFELKLARLARAFMTEPRSFSFSMEPDTPLSIDDMARIIEVAPETLHDRLRVLVTANASQ